MHAFTLMVSSALIQMHQINEPGKFVRRIEMERAYGLVH